VYVNAFRVKHAHYSQIYILIPYAAPKG